MDSIIEKTGVCRGLRYWVVITPMGHRCGYTEVAPEEIAGDGRYCIYDIDCHGGLTFSHPSCGFFDNTPVVGFDCNHWGDSPDASATISAFGGAASIIPYIEHGHVWTAEEVEAECKCVCNQIIEARRTAQINNN